MHKTKLTDLSIRALKPPEKGNSVAWDEAIPGFGVRVSQGGTKSFFLMYGKERARHQIGRVGVISLSEAREAARKFLAQRTLGNEEAPTLTSATRSFYSLRRKTTFGPQPNATTPAF